MLALDDLYTSGRGTIGHPHGVNMLVGTVADKMQIACPSSRCRPPPSTKTSAQDRQATNIVAGETKAQDGEETLEFAPCAMGSCGL